MIKLKQWWLMKTTTPKKVMSSKIPKCNWSKTKKLLLASNKTKIVCIISNMGKKELIISREYFRYNQTNFSTFLVKCINIQLEKIQVTSED